jgi:non-ribosomal peptide synthetase component F
MGYELKIFDADVSPEQCLKAQQLFCKVLENNLGDAALVAPVYAAYQRLVQTYGEQPALEILDSAEREIFEQWQAAETAAVTATFGTHRYMGDAMYEIILTQD